MIKVELENATTLLQTLIPKQAKETLFVPHVQIEPVHIYEFVHMQSTGASTLARDIALDVLMQSAERRALFIDLGIVIFRKLNNCFL